VGGVSRRKKKTKKKTKKKKKGISVKSPPLLYNTEEEEESAVDMIRRHALESGRIELADKLKGLEAKPLPDTMSPQEIEDDLNEILE
jgi:uncharacterized protein YtpQ (UPF0354 family)